MAGRVVEYIFQLVDKFSKNAADIAKSAMGAEKNIHGMGAAANAAEKKVRGAAAAIKEMNAKAVAANPAMANAVKIMKGYGEAGEAASRSVRTVTQAHREIGMLQKEAKLNAKYAGGGLGGGMLGGMAEAWFGADMIIQAAKGVGKFLDAADHQMTAKTKMRFVGFKGELMTQADELATQLSKKYPNISKGDVLDQFYEGVAIHGDAKHALENVEAQTRLASFLQGFEGGKHGKNSKEWTREVFAAIKSMEQFGILNEHDPAKKTADISGYLGSLMSMKALYGEQAKIQEYLTAQRRAGASFYRLSEEFRFGYLPAMVQEQGGSTVGQQLMTAFQTIVGGTKLSKNQLSAMNKYGMIDPKTGRFAQRFVDSYLKSPFETAQFVAADVAKKNKLNMNDATQRERLKDILVREMGWLFPNRNAASRMLDMFMNDKNYRKHAEGLIAVKHELDAIAKGEFFAAKTRAGAEGSIAKQFENLMGALGGPLYQPYLDRLNGMAGVFNRLSQSIGRLTDRHPRASGMVGTAAMYGLGALGALAGAGALGGLGRGIAWGLAPIGAAVIGSYRMLASAMRSVWRASSLLSVGKFAGLATGLYIGYEVVENWSTLVGVLERLSGLNLDKLKDLKGGVSELAKIGAALPQVVAETAKAVTNPNQPDDGTPEYDATGAFTGMKSSPAASVPQGEAAKEIAVRTSVDPIAVNVTQSIPLNGTVNVQVTGTVNGAVNGSGSGTVTGAASGSALAPRGESMPVGDK